MNAAEGRGMLMYEIAWLVLVIPLVIHYNMSRKFYFWPKLRAQAAYSVDVYPELLAGLVDLDVYESWVSYVYKR
jgi:hypothetical protein